MWKKITIWVISVAFLLTGPSASLAETTVPEGWVSDSIKVLRPGVVHQRLSSTQPQQVVNIARVSPGADVAFRPMVAGGELMSDMRAARTSAMCRLISCILAVNGDFFDLDTQLPLGGLFYRGEILRSPSSVHHQLVFGPDGEISAGPMATPGSIVTSDLGKKEITSVNRDRGQDELVVFTSAWGKSTATNAHGVELVAKIEEPDGPLRIGQTVRVSITGRHDGGDAPIPSGGMVLSGHGAQAAWLEGVWASIRSGDLSRDALIRVDGTVEGIDSIGGTPILLRDSKIWFTDEATSFVRGRHPRTMIGWTAERETIIVTVDGRQPGYSTGMSLVEAAELMLSLGAVEALNLDGGGSTTFVTAGDVINRPSDRVVKRAGSEKIVAVPRRGDVVIGNVERPVPVALALVPRGVAPAPTADPLSGLALPRVYALPLPATDPGSLSGDHLSTMPALVGPSRVERPDALAASAGLAYLVIAMAMVLHRRRERTKAFHHE